MRERGREETEALGWVKKLLTDFFFVAIPFMQKILKFYVEIKIISEKILK